MPMNRRRSFILFAFAFSLTMMSKPALSFLYIRSVWIRNLLHSGNDLVVHCKTADQDMGYHRVHPTGSYGFRHESNTLAPEILWCHLWQGPNFKHHQVFDVYYIGPRTWEAKEDGIYGFVLEESTLEMSKLD
ncbi:unnamed protein product [Microthlaspi erraticum]|uniref:S-protein homolog n=1 Tax=Microthlaspi erraticum TaxID=1685480 RepID=A0A6D2IFK8_9BRAS|nr:unnamed protein product [Microthlaspi erraticum]